MTCLLVIEGDLPIVKAPV